MPTFDDGDSAALVCYPSRLLFAAGDYPDKGFSCSPEQLELSAGDDPLPLDLEHTPTLLDGSLGHVRNRRVEKDGDRTILRGDVYISRWLDNILPRGKSNLSATFDRPTFKMQKLALVANPRVPDAVLMAAAFSAGVVKPDAVELAGARHDTPEGQSVLQNIHDMSARAGAKCDRKGAVEMHSGHEIAGLQAVHDATADHGATCKKMGGDGDGRPLSYLPMFTAAPEPAGKGARMKWSEWFSKTFGVAGDAEVPPGTPEPAATQFSELKVAEPVLDPRIAAMQAEIDGMKAKERQTLAASFARDQVRTGKALPAEATGVEALYLTAAADDAAHPTTVTFGEGKTGSRVDALTASFEARPAHSLFNELVPVAAGGQALQNRAGTAEMKAEEVRSRADAILATTPEGRAALDRRNKVAAMSNGRGGN